MHSLSTVHTFYLHGGGRARNSDGIVCYRPQRSCEGYVFTGVCLTTGGEYLTRYTPEEQTPPGADPPWEHTGPPGTRYTPLGPGTPPSTRYTPRADTPLGPGTHPQDQVHPPGTRYTPWDQVHPLGPGTPPLPRYGHCCGRYASYWNAFLFTLDSTHEIYIPSDSQESSLQTYTHLFSLEVKMVEILTDLNWK